MTEFVPEYTRRASREKVYSELHVSGRGNAKCKPDMFSITFRLIKEALKKDEAYDEVSKNTESLLKILKKWACEGDSVTCDTLSVYQLRAYEAYGRWKKGEKITRVTSTIHVVSARVDDVSTLIDLGMKSGVCETYGAEFFLSDEAKLKLRAKALDIAIQAAQFDATHSAQALGIILLGSKSVDVSGEWDGYYDVNYDEPMNKCSLPLSKFSNSTDSEVRQFIEPEDAEISVSVSIVFVYDDIYARNAAEALEE